MDKDSIRLVNIVPVVNGWKTTALENKREAQKLMNSGNIPDYNAGLVKSAAADLVAGMAGDLLKAPVIDPETLRPTAHIIRGYVPETKDGVFCDGCNCCLGWEYGAHVIGYFKYCPYCGYKLEDATGEIGGKNGNDQ